MAKLPFTLLVLLLLSVGGLHVEKVTLALSAELIQGGETLPPVYKRGEAWTYRAETKVFYGSTSRNLLNGEYKITLLPGKRLITKIEGGRVDEEKEPGLLGAMLPTRAVINHKSQFFQFPLVVGKKWKTNYYHEFYREWISPEMVVTGIESVTTPAGLFAVYRIEQAFSYSRVFPGIGESWEIYEKMIYFYSPQARSIVNLHYQLDFGENVGSLITGSTVDIELVKSPQ